MGVKRSSFGNFSNRYVVYSFIVVLGLLGLLVFNYLLSMHNNIVVVNGYSMIPTFNDGDEVEVVGVGDYLEIQPLRVGDIVVFKTPQATIQQPKTIEKMKNISSLDESVSIKRIVGVPGDKFKVVYGKVYVNGELLTHNTLDLLNIDENILKGYYVLGDNPTMSIDSRDYGEIDIKDILYVVKEQDKYKDNLGGFEEMVKSAG